MIDEKELFVGHMASASVPGGTEMGLESGNTIPTMIISFRYHLTRTDQ